MKGWLGFLLSQHQLSLAGCLFDLAGSTFGPTGNWLQNLCLAGNPVTRIPDFVQPWISVIFIEISLDRVEIIETYQIHALGNYLDCNSLWLYCYSKI